MQSNALSEMRNHRPSQSERGDRTAASGNPAALTAKIAVSDPAIHETLAPPWEFVIKAQSKGPYDWRVEHVTTRSYVIYREDIGSAVRLMGWSPRGMIAFLVPLITPLKSTLWWQAIGEQTLSCALNTGIDCSFAAGQSHYMVLIERAFLRRVLSEDGAEQLERAARARVLPLSADALTALVMWLRSVLAEAAQRPQLVSSASSVEALGIELAFRLYGVLGPDSARGQLTTTARARIIEGALAFLRESQEPRATVFKLCSAVGVSKRTMEYAFREQFDLTPQAFLRRHRLHAARRRLLAEDPHSSSVTRIAEDLGFWHLSRFAADYNAAFGENPASARYGIVRSRSVLPSISRSLEVS
jgi:AraC family transcriptional regulator, ethanolamine operon transcriptional activator